MGIGIWIAADKNSVLTILKAADGASENADVHNVASATVLEQAAYMLIAAGAVIFILGFLGCCGAMHESKCLLITYAVLLFLILGLEIGAGIYAAVAKDKFRNDLKSLMLRSLKTYKPQGKEDAVTLGWNYVFAQFECCGVDSGQDLQISEWAQAVGPLGETMPVACCVLSDKSKFTPQTPATCPGRAGLRLNSNYDRGCYGAVLKWVDNYMTLVIGVAIGLGLVQFLAFIFACCLCCSLDNRK